MLSPTHRRLLALSTGTATLVLLAVWALFGANALEYFFYFRWDVGGPLSQAPGPRPNSYDPVSQNVYLLAIGAILLATGGSVSLLVMLPRSGFRVRAWVYLTFLIILLPMSVYNYGQRDHVFPTYAQAGLNMLLIFLAGTTAMWLASARAEVPDTKVLKFLSLSLLLFGGVFVPGLFTALWFLQAVGMLSVKQTEEVGFQQIAGLSGVLSAIVAWLNYRKGQQSTPVTPAKIVRP